MGENTINEVAINMDVGIGEELDYEANDITEHEEDSVEKIETNQHERIVKEVSTSDSESMQTTAVKERTNDKDLPENNNLKDSKSPGDTKLKNNEAGGLMNPKNDEKIDKDSKDKQQTSSGRSACKPCNLLFENKKWMDKHNDSGDHTHVIKGFNPGGGKYYCYLCWLGFEHSEMLLHHIKRSEHITRARRRGVCDLYLKPAHKIHEKTNSKQKKSGERIHHRSTTHSHINSQPTHKSSSHKSSSGTSHRSRSPLRIRLSDYYEVSSVGHCDMRGARLRTLHNGAHKSRGKQGEESSVKDQSSSKTVEQGSRSKNENLSCEPNQLNGSADPKELSGTNIEGKDLDAEQDADPPYIDKGNEDTTLESKSESKEPSENVSKSIEAGAELFNDTT